MNKLKILKPEKKCRNKDISVEIERLYGRYYSPTYISNIRSGCKYSRPMVPMINHAITNLSKKGYCNDFQPSQKNLKITNVLL